MKKQTDYILHMKIEGRIIKFGKKIRTKKVILNTKSIQQAHVTICKNKCICGERI